jgi:hypothetical protein
MEAKDTTPDKAAEKVYVNSFYMLDLFKKKIELLL